MQTRHFWSQSNNILYISISFECLYSVFFYTQKTWWWLNRRVKELGEWWGCSKWDYKQRIIFSTWMCLPSSAVTPQGMTLPSGSFWCNRCPRCLATGTSLKCSVTVTTRVRGQADEYVLYTRTQLYHCWMCAPQIFFFFLWNGGLDGAVSKLLRAVVTLNSTSVWEIDVGPVIPLENHTSFITAQVYMWNINHQRQWDRTVKSRAVRKPWNFRGFLKMEPLAAVGARGSLYDRFVS